MVRPNRAITIDRKAIAELAKKLALGAAEDLQDRLDEKGLEIDGSTALGELCHGAALRWAEGPGHIIVEVRTRNAPGMGSSTAGGHFECPHYGSAHGDIVVFLNESYPLHRFLSPVSWGIDRDIERVLVHEFTHAVDPRTRTLCQDRLESYNKKTGSAYFNEPAEVKAVSAQAIADVLPPVAEWRETGRLPSSYFTPKRGGVNAVVQEVLKRSLLLQLRLDHMSPRNQARVMRDLYRALEDEGLLDEPAPKKNPAGAFVSGEFWYVNGKLIEVDDHELAAPKILQGLGVRVNIDALTQLLKLGGVRIYDGMREGGVPITGLDVWRLDKPTLRSLQDVLLKLKRVGSHEVDIDVTSTFSDESEDMEHLHLTAADVLEATSARELYAAGMVVRENTRS
jgi:hypothetical protein